MKELGSALSELKRERLVVTATQSGIKRRKLVVNEKEATTNFERTNFLHPLASIEHYVRGTERYQYKPKVDSF